MICTKRHCLRKALYLTVRLRFELADPISLPLRLGRTNTPVLTYDTRALWRRIRWARRDPLMPQAHYNIHSTRVNVPNVLLFILWWYFCHAKRPRFLGVSSVVLRVLVAREPVVAHALAHGHAQKSDGQKEERTASGLWQVHQPQASS